MPHSRRKLDLIGCKMNDASYPFRGEFKMDDRINHGHSGIARRTPTSLALRIAGSNLVIEQLRVPKGQSVKCELSVNGGIPRSVEVEASRESGLAVPGDGKDYTLTTTVQGDTKHFCRLTLNGSEGMSFVRVRAPEQVKRVRLRVDGKYLHPVAGYYCIPIGASECALEADGPPFSSVARDFCGFSISPLGGPAEEVRAACSTEGAARTGSPLVGTPLRLDSIPGTAETAAPLGATTAPWTPLGEEETAAVVVPGGGDPYGRLPPRPSRGAAPVAWPGPAAAEAACGVPEVETGVHQRPEGRVYVARARGFVVQLTAEDGAMASGLDEAVLPLPHAREQVVGLLLGTGEGRPVLRQTVRLPALQATPLHVGLRDVAGRLLVTAEAGSEVSVDGAAPVSGATGAFLDRSGRHSVTVGRSAAAVAASPGGALVLEVEAAPASEPVAPAAASAAASAAAAGGSGFAHQVLQALEAACAGEAALTALHRLLPSGPREAAVVDFLRDRLAAPVPSFTFAVEAEGLSGVECAGYHIFATVANEAPRAVPFHGTVRVGPAPSLLLTAQRVTGGPPVATCQMQLRTAAERPEETVLARLMDSLQRHNMDPRRVAEEWSAVSPSTLSPEGARLLPWMLGTLRRAAPAATESIYVTCENGFLSNIYTTRPDYHLLASVNDQPPFPLAQRGRLPAVGAWPAGSPHFVRLLAQEPLHGAVMAEMVLTVMGPAATSSAPPAGGTAAVLPAASPVYSAEPLGPPAGGGGDVAGRIAPSPASMPYLDITLLQIDPDVQMRCLCRPSHRLVCDVDGVGGDTGRSDFVTKFHGARSHLVELSVLDAGGGVVFQQKLQVPALCSSAWNLSLRDAELAVEPDYGACMTVSVDRQPEVTLRGGGIPLDGRSAHSVLLRKYVNGARMACAGELVLSLPLLVSAARLEELIRLYQLRARGDLSDAGLRARLEALLERCSTDLLGDLLHALLEAWGEARPSPALPPVESPEESKRIYFRLTGSE